MVRSLSEGLSSRFNIQISNLDITNIEDLYGMVSPDIFIFCQSGDDDLNMGFLEWHEDECRDIPVFVVTSKEDWEKISDKCQASNFRRKFRPVALHSVIEAMRELLEETELLKEQKRIFTREQDPGNKKRVMIVDDSPLFLRTTKSILEEEGYEIFLAPSGEKALKQIPRKRPHLVLLDYEMGGMSGKDTLEEMRKDERMRDIPVIFVTNSSEKEKIIEVLKYGTKGYILKPVDKEMLIKEVNKVLDYV